MPPGLTLNTNVRPHHVVLDGYAPWAYSHGVLTVVESPLFQKLWPLYWSEDERGEFAAYIASAPTVGAVILESGGLRKVRWARPGSGKSGGVRIIYYARTEEGKVMLLTMFAKGNTGNIPTAKLKEIRRALEK